MGTVNRSIAEQIAAGKYRSDKPVKIVKYKNGFDGGEAFGVVHAGEPLNRYEETGFGSDFEVWWTVRGGRTGVA